MWQLVLSIGFIAILEVILSIDNAIVLALVARHLPEEQQKKALTYGLIGAVAFRLLALFFITSLIRFRWVKFAGGAYLLFVGLKALMKKREDHSAPRSAEKPRSFIQTVLVIEMMDIAFAVDSILAAAAIAKQIMIVFVGGMIGVIMMRFAASVFLTVLKRFPRFETAAYVLIVLIGTKLTIEGFHPSWARFESPSHWSFQVFWGAMILSFLSGFIQKQSKV